MHEVFGHPVTNTPTKLTEERAKIRASFMQEELEEFLEATTVEDQYDALIDLIYFAFGTFAEMGVRPDKGFEIVNNANMAKLFPDGKPRFREGDGKILKPEGWQAPEPQLRAEIERQRQEVEKLLGFPSSFYYVFFWQSLMTHVSRMSCCSTNASRSCCCPLLLLQFHLSKEKIVVDTVDTVGIVDVVDVVGLGNLDDHVDLGGRDGLDGLDGHVDLGGRGDLDGHVDLGDRGDLDDHVDLGGRGGHGDHGDLDEFDKEQPADVYDGVRDDVLVVDDVHDDLGDLGGDGVHDGHGDLGGDVHDGHGDLDDRRGGHGDRKTLWITTYSACHNTYSRYRKSCLYSSNERWECSWYAHWYSSRCSAYKCWDSCLCSSY